MDRNLTIQYQVFTEPILVPANPTKTESTWHYRWQDPKQTIFGKVIKGAFIALIASGPILPPQGFPSSTSADKWEQPWSTPQSVKLDRRTHLVTAAQQFTAFQLDKAQQPEQVTESRWHQPWSEPVRFKIDPKRAIALAASGAYLPTPSTSIQIPVSSWFKPFNEPVRVPVRLQTGAQKDFFYGSVKPAVSFAYYNWLTEPVRQKPGLRASLQQFAAQDTVFIPTPAKFEEGWFSWLSEPVRLPIGLKAWLQQTLAHPPRLLPTPTVTAVLSATETNNDRLEITILIGGKAAKVKYSIIESGGDRAADSSIEES